MTFLDEWEILKKWYSQRCKEIHEKYKDEPDKRYLDGGRSAEDEINSIWKNEVLPELEKLKSKYGINKVDK